MRLLRAVVVLHMERGDIHFEVWEALLVVGVWIVFMAR